jgi:thiol-disulfide isomerase/thioredoxin
VGTVLSRWRKGAFEALVIAAIVIAVQVWQARGLPEGPAPALAGTLLDGRAVTLDDTVAAAGGKPVLVAFWATWCSICKAEAGNLDDLAAGVPFLGVAMQSGDDGEVRKYLADRKHRIPSINDIDGQISARWKVAGVPTHFIVDGHGNIRFRVVGYASEWGLRARLWWAKEFPR